MTYYDAATRWIKTHRAGEPGYYEPRKRGTVTVHYDNVIFVYRFPPNPDKRAVRKALERAFLSGGKLTGKFPQYECRSF